MKKKLVSLLLVAALLLMLVPVDVRAADCLYGDVNGDGKINAKDATLILRYAVGKLTDLSEYDWEAANVNADNTVNAKDATLILRYSVNKLDKFPADTHVHSYVASSAEGDGEQEVIEYVCTVCGDKITQNLNQAMPGEVKEKTFLPDRDADFTFLVSCNQGEAYLRANLTVTGENGTVSYNVTAEENGIYRIAATELYQQYQTYHVQVAEDMLFPEYNAKALEFSIIGPDRAEVEFNDDNLIFLKALELKQYGESGLYELQWDEAAQRYYLTLFELKGIEPSMIGKVIGIGDYTSTEEIFSDSTRELCFAKLETISHNADGDLLLELSVPQLSEVYDKLEIYFAGDTEGMEINGDPELAFMNAVVSSEGFAEYFTATHLAAESYASDHGLVVTPLAETSKDNLQFKLTKHSLTNTEDSNTCKLELGGEIIYTIPMKTEAGQASGSIVMTCYAELTASISAGGHFKDQESVNLYLTNDTTTTLKFGMKFNMEYSNAYEEIYLIHKNTQKIHTATCRIANKETNPANLQKLTAQELSEWYHGDREMMQEHECKVCMAVTGLNGTAYAYNRNTGVLHCMNCRHVTDIKECNLYTLYPDNTFAFTNCNDCKPQERQVKDFDNRMLNAIKGSDWAEQVTSFQEMLGETIGSQKPSMDTDPDLSVPINIAGVFNIEIGVAPVFEFDMEASVNFSITASTTNTYGIRSVGEGFEAYNDETPGQVECKLNFTGKADVKFGIAMVVKAYPVGCEDFANIAINGQLGLYGHLTGIFAVESTVEGIVEGTVEGDTDAYCAARLEAGLYARMDGYWKILWFDGNFQILKEQRLPLFKWGYDRMYYAFEEEEIEWTVEDPDEFVLFNLSMLMKAKYLDLATMEYKTDTISPISKSRLSVMVEIKNEDGSSCDYLEYNPQNGMIQKEDSAPESFTAVITVQVIPKVQINSFDDFLDSETDDLVYGYSMDPLVVTLKVTEDTNPYQDILDMYYTSISCNWTNCDGEGEEDIGDPDNACYMFRYYFSDYALSEVGYAMLDTNKDGQPELLVSLMEQKESGSIYDLYTIVDGEIVHVVSAGERDWYALAADYSINNGGSSGASSSVNINYRLDHLTGELKVNQAVIYDDTINSENPWFYATTDYHNKETHQIDRELLTSISGDEAMALIDGFPEDAVLELIPFDEYMSSSNKVEEEIKPKVLEQVNIYQNDDLYQMYTFQYDRNEQLSGAVYHDDYTTANFSFSYDEAGRLLAADRDDFWLYFGNDEYIYDKSGQLICHKYYWGGEIPYHQSNYEYDEQGNMIGETCLIPNYDDNALETYAVYSYSYVYDSHGRVVEKQAYNVWIDSDFNMTTKYGEYLYSEYVTVTGYSYDSLGRVKSVCSTDIPEFMCNPQGNPDLEWDDQTSYNYDYAPLVLVQSANGDSTVQIQDSVGQIIWSQYLGNSSLDIDAEGYIVGSTDTYNEYRYELIYDDQENSQEPEIPQNSETAIKISEEDAYKIACEYWNYSEGAVSPETGFEMYVVPEYGEALKEDTKTGKYYYCYLLRWLVVDENGDSWMSTCDIVHIDAETGECTYFS